MEDDVGTHNPKIKRGLVSSLSIYEITDHELETLQAGSPATLLVNFAIALLSIATSFWITVFSTEIKDPRRYAVFVAVALFGTINGTLLVFLWWRKRGSIQSLVKKIKSRIPPDTVAPGAAQTSGAEEETAARV